MGGQVLDHACPTLSGCELSTCSQPVAASVRYPTRARAPPISLGVGKVWKVNDHLTVNAFLEPQYTVWRNGDGVPRWQIFGGVNLQSAETAPPAQRARAGSQGRPERFPKRNVRMGAWSWYHHTHDCCDRADAPL